MGGVRNGKSAGTPEPAAVRQEALRPGATGGMAAVDTSDALSEHFRVAARLLRDGSAARAFGELARASRILPMTPRLAAGIVRMALRAGTEAAAIILLESALSTASSRRAVQRQLARVLRRVNQLPRAIAALEMLLAEWPEDRRAQRVLQVLRARVSTAGEASGPEAAAPSRDVLAKLPALKDGTQDAATWEYDDRIYLIETVVGPPLAAATPSSTVTTPGDAMEQGPRSQSQAEALPSPEGEVRASEAHVAQTSGPRESAGETHAAQASGARESAGELSAVDVASKPPGASPVMPGLPVDGASSTSPTHEHRAERVNGAAPSMSEAPSAEGVSEASAPEHVSGAPADSARKSVAELPAIGPSPMRPADNERLPAREVSLPAAAVDAHKTVLELPVAVVSSTPVSTDSASKGAANGAIPESPKAVASGPGVESFPWAPVVDVPPKKSAVSEPAVGARPVAVAGDVAGAVAGVSGKAVPGAPGAVEPARTILELPAVAVPSTEPVADAPRTLVEMPVVAEPPRASDFEARRTEVEMPAVDAGAPSPGSGAVREFVPRRESPSVPWVDIPEEGARVPSPATRQGAHRRDLARRDDADAEEVTSEAQPFLAGEGALPAPPRVPAPAKVGRRKTPAPAEALPPAGVAKGGAASDARSGTMEVSLEELQAALSGGTSRPEGRADAARPGGHGEDAEALNRSRKAEAQLIARRAWAELAQLYLERADAAKDAALRADALARLAELMENELHDPAGAARMYREIVDLTGDRAALRDQVRLLAARGDASLVRRALDEAIRRAPTSRARAGALLTRGERWLHMGELQKARADFEAAEALAPGLLPVLAGLLHCVPGAERSAIAERLRGLLAATPRRAPDRAEALRALAEVAEEALNNPRLAQWAWSEVLAESPDSEQARAQLTALARRLGDTTVLGKLLRAQLARESRGPAARQARLELVATLEARGNAEAALDELRQAVRYEPGHKEAWLMLVERLLQREQLSEAAWALEHAATATEDEEERERTWDRLARLWREVMGNPERARIYARRAEGIRQAREANDALPPEPPRSASPRREPSGPRASLAPAPSVQAQSSVNSGPLAGEATSTTDPGAVAPAQVPPAPASRKVASDGAASRTAAPAAAAPASPARKGRRGRSADRAVPSEADAKEGAQRSGHSKASRDDARGAASVPGTAAVPAPRAPATADDTQDAAAFPKAPQGSAPGGKSRAAARAAASGRGAEPAPAPPDEEARGPRSGATDLITGELMDLGASPVPETRVISWEAPPGRMDPVRRVVRARPEGTVSAPAPGRTFVAKPPAAPEPRPAPGAAETRESPVAAYSPPQDTEPDAFRHIRERPLDAKPYRLLAEYFEQRGDPARASLMREIADALDGLETPAPRGQRPPLTSDERAGLRHPGLRTPSGELLACTGIALCRLFPAEGRAAGSSEPLRATAGPAAPAVLDALHSAARMLDVHLPELVLAEDDGPPFTAVHAGHPRLLVGRLLLRESMPAAELRFHAGRALLSLSPDLLALRALKGGQLLRALALLSTVLKDPRASGDEARVVRESLSPRALERAMALLEPGTRDFKASALADAARDSANRAGLVACGSVGPALTVLRARRGNEAELVELLRFAASERYLPLRAPR